MSEYEQSGELLDQFWSAVREDPDAPRPDGLDEGIARLTARLEQRLRPPEPEAAFAGDLWQRLTIQAAAANRARPAGRLFRLPLPKVGWQLAGLATAALLLAALVTVGPWLSKPRTVSAEVIVARALAASTDLVSSGVRSFTLTEETVMTGRNRLAPQGGEVRSEQRVSYRTPASIRIEQQYTQLPGREPDDAARVTVSDGETLWSYDPEVNVVNISGGQVSAGRVVAPYGGEDLSQVLDNARSCGEPKLLGEERVAGRRAYIVDLGPNLCPSASAGSSNGPQTVWVDKDTFFVLKRVVLSDDGASVVYTSEVTRIRYNLQLSDQVFTFTPPAGVQVQDDRARPAPGADAYQQQLAVVAKEGGFPLFAPRELPIGLVPRSPRPLVGPDSGWQLDFVPAPDASSDTPAELQGFAIRELRATDENLSRYVGDARPATIDRGQAWVRPGVRNPDGTASSSTVIVLRDGTLLAISSFRYSADELLNVANSLESVH